MADYGDNRHSLAARALCRVGEGSLYDGGRRPGRLSGSGPASNLPLHEVKASIMRIKPQRIVQPMPLLLL